MGLSGKYELVSKQEFRDFLLKTGIPAEHAQKVYDNAYTLEVKVEADKVTLSVQHSLVDKVNTYPFGKEVEESIKDGLTLKNTASLDGDVLTIVFTSGDGNNGKRIYSTNGNDLTEAISTNNGNVTLKFKRL